MTITIDLDRDVEDKVEARAAARGVPVKEYVEGLVREAADATPCVRPGSDSRPSIEEFEADFAAMADGLDDIPPLPPEAFSRQAMYERD